MTMTLPVATVRIARDLKHAERAHDDALLASSTLLASMISARAHPDVVVHTGQAAILRLHQAQGSLIKAQNDLFRVHDELSGIGRAVGTADEENSTPPSGLIGVADESAQAA